MSNGVLRGTSIVSALTLLSRLLGFVRDLLVAKLFGAGIYSDAYLVAFRIPNLLRSLFAEGALTSAFVPTFATEIRKGKAEGQEAISAVSGLLLFVTLSLALLGIIFATEIVRFIAPGFGVGTEKADLCILLTRIMIPYIVFVSIVALLNGALNTVKIFGTSARAQVWMNVTLIIGALIALLFQSPLVGTILLALSVIAGGIVQMVVQMPALRRAGFHLKPTLRFRSFAVQQTLRLILPAILGATIYQISIFMSTFLASLVGSGAISWLFYADRLIQLPIGVFSIALASVLLPTLAVASAEEDEEKFSASLNDALRYTSFCIVPVALFLYQFADPLIHFMFERGQFTRESTRNTALAVQAMSFGIWSTSCHTMLVRAFVARSDSKTPAYVGILTLLAMIFFSITFMGPPHEANSSMAQFVIAVQTYLPFQQNLGHVGLSLSSTLSSSAGFLILLGVFTVRNREISWISFLRSSTQALIAAVISILLVRNIFPGHSYEIWNVGGSMILLGSAYFLSLKLLHSQEAKETAELIPRIYRRFFKSR